jgi:Tn3 transposase DDE domain
MVANLLVFHNVVTLTKALQRLEADDEVLGALSPYQTEHINRFGAYVLNFDRMSEPPK